MGMQELVMEFAMKEFAKELKKPDSPIAKKFRETLFGVNGDGQGGMFEKALNGRFDDKKPRMSDDEVKKAMGSYKRKGWQTVLDNVLPTVGTTVQTIGDVGNVRNSLLGDALLAMSSAIQQPGFANPLPLMPVVAAGKKARGGIEHLLGTGVNNIATDISKDIKHNREKENEAELLLRERPSGQFYDARRKLTTN